MSFLKSAATVIAALLMTASASAAPEIGMPAPEFSAVNSNGTSVRLSDYRGKTVVLEWTNDGCPYVKKHYSSGNMQALQKEAAAKSVVWLTIISSAPGAQGYLTGEQANKLTETRGAAPAAVILDPEGELGHLYDARTTPHLFIVNKDGALVYMGGVDDKATTDVADIMTARNYVREALDRLASGAPIENAVTRPYGCSVKYKTAS